MIFVLSIPLNQNAYVVDCMGKVGYRALSNLMHTLLLLHLINLNHCD